MTTCEYWLTIWEVTHVSEEELETTEGEGVVDFLTDFLEMEGWTQVKDLSCRT